MNNKSTLEIYYTITSTIKGIMVFHNYTGGHKAIISGFVSIYTDGNVFN